ncbi:FAD-dependent oxidoreductase [Reinekea marina]|uniref:NAD(P)/FAD-dependent oxidoreductase n=1 Tax=Reinekea marina TaxID=1310421 RepID=A0ABV7WTY1_9GAMM|nr:FAD-dependent oxidoreductase [Reinekea marina]MDN3649798.1 FAD-dependent oxidoreductase [Reinekea marina]
MSRKKIAIIGSGISGLTAAAKLHPNHDIHVFEANDIIGGHTHTEQVEIEGKTYGINTGFIVYNDWVYKNFNELMAPLNLKRVPTEMSFSIKDDITGLEYNGHNLDTLFAQRRNLFSPKFYKMIKDILKFNRESIADYNANAIDESLTLAEYFNQKNLGKMFINKYIIPMGAAIWSSGEADMMNFPALFFIRFFKNHGLLSIKDRPQWYTLEGGSAAYLEPLSRPFKDKITTSARIKTVIRKADSVELVMENNNKITFDEVVFACHSDQALALLDQPSQAETEILGAIPYTPNEVILHTDESLLPKRRKAWAAWNYHLGIDNKAPASLTYNMNMLQSIEDAPVTFCVTLNRTQLIDPSKIIGRYQYDHPVFGPKTEGAQARYHEIGNQQRTHFCGAYWFNGFHEDGVNSALRVVQDIESQQSSAGTASTQGAHV